MILSEAFKWCIIVGPAFIDTFGRKYRSHWGLRDLRGYHFHFFPFLNRVRFWKPMLEEKPVLSQSFISTITVTSSLSTLERFTHTDKGESEKWRSASCKFARMTGLSMYARYMLKMFVPVGTQVRGVRYSEPFSPRGNGNKRNKDKYKRKIPTRTPSPQYVKQGDLKLILETKVPLTFPVLKGPLYLEVGDRR